MSELPLRKCFVLREIEVDMISIKAGDIFRQEPVHGKEDKWCDSEEYSMASNDAKLIDEASGNSIVTCVNVEFLTKNENGTIKLLRIKKLGDKE